MDIVKAEILWTRKCNLNCSYCGMFRTGEEAKVKKDWDKWKRGIRNLKNLGCGFTAVYGAEPLMDMEYLPEYFEEVTKNNIYHTLITNCSDKDTRKKITELVKAGLNSLTVSFDGTEGELNDKSSNFKSYKGLETVEWFQKTFPKYRDVAVVFTLTRTNLFNILDWLPVFSDKGIFVFFDLIHSDIDNPGTKCRNYPGIEELLFETEEDEKLLREFLIRLKKMKDEGKYTIHQSYSFINLLLEDPKLYTHHKWNCAIDSSFPSWLTIDYDGLVRICDDFYLKGKKDWYFWNLSKKKFNGEFTKYWKEMTLKHCKGCFWNTHVDANMIKSGRETFGDYINNCL